MPKICNFTEKWTPPRKFPYEFPKLFKKLFLRTPSSSCSRRLLFYCKINIAIILLMQSNAEALLEPCHIYDGTFSQKYVTAESHLLFPFRKNAQSWMFDRRLSLFPKMSLLLNEDLVFLFSLYYLNPKHGGPSEMP